MLPTLLSRRAPEIETTSIEIDHEVVEVARKYFAFAPDANDRVIVGDGRRELERQVGGADVIVVDAYFSDSLPFHLITREFDALCARKLSPGGAVAVNFGGDLTGARNQLFWAAVRTLGEVFPRVYVFSRELRAGAPVFRGNAIVVSRHARPSVSTPARSPTARRPLRSASGGRASPTGPRGSTRERCGSPTFRSSQAR